MSNIMIPQDIRSLSRQRAPRFHGTLKTPQPDRIEPGQIWSTRLLLELPDGHRFETNEPRLVVILEGTGLPSELLEQITVAPLSLPIQLAAESDLIVSGDASPLGFDFMVEVWNETPVLKGHLRRFLGRLPDEAVAAMRSLYRAQLLDEDVPPTLAGQVGLRIMGESDSRLAFQEAEIEAAAYLAQAATAALTLEVTAKEPARATPALSKSRLRLELPLMIGRLPDFSIAYAAGTVGDEDTYIVSHVGDEEHFTFELLVDRLPPYEVYLVVHQVSPELENRRCVITIQTAERELQSAPTALEVDAEIQVGRDPDFVPREGQLIKVEIV